MVQQYNKYYRTQIYLARASVRTARDCMLISYCWNCPLFLHHLFCLEVFGAYMQVLFSRSVRSIYASSRGGRELLIRATTDGNSFLSESLFAQKLEKVKVQPILELFLQTETAPNFTFHLQSLRSVFKISAYFPSASTWCFVYFSLPSQSQCIHLTKPME